MRNGGLIKYEKLLELSDNKKYIEIIDQIYINYGISLENFDFRIFPKLLRDDAIEINQPFLEYLKDVGNTQLLFKDQKYDISKILLSLSEMKGQCVNASKNDALFSWKENAILYYHIQRIGNAIDGFKIQLDVRMSGKKEEISKRILDEFIQNVANLFGNSIVADISSKKKANTIERKIIHDAALSFAGEQRKFVSEVANIFQSEGIDIFYDEFYEGKLWGENLAEYLWNIYYKQSKYCIMFISTEYITKAWPTHEKRLAIAKEIETLGGYILPVRFDDSEVPGLDPDIKYIRANTKWPEEGKGKDPKEIVDAFINKISP